MDTDESIERLVNIPDRDVILEGVLNVPRGATSVVLFAHGSGSSRHSPRNNYVAGILREHGIGTLLLDLLTPEEDLDYEMRFNIDLLAQRLITATKWLQEEDEAYNFAIGYFGASTGAAAAIQSAAVLGDQIGAIVSRGGRPDMAEPYLGKVEAPTLLIVGGYDGVVIEMNRSAYERLKGVKQLEIIPGATHLFEEPGTLERVAELAARWFEKHLNAQQPLR
ncbi:MAG: alpha/beta hydrolase [Actinobacteria bacterium]|nr:alpha/beta hydrolase [Actinomycetota bacterium]